VDLKIFNSLGKKVGEFNEGLKEPGYYQVNFNGTGLPSGVYYYRMILISPDGLQSVSSVKKMILLK
jgi:hypothetical protein